MASLSRAFIEATHFNDLCEQDDCCATEHLFLQSLCNNYNTILNRTEQCVTVLSLNRFSPNLFVFYQDYVIDSNWRFRSTVMTPMFVDTQATQGQESLGSQQGGTLGGQLRATQASLEFSQTQTSGTATL